MVEKFQEFVSEILLMAANAICETFRASDYLIKQAPQVD
jgi:hypothetical protein